MILKMLYNGGDMHIICLAVAESRCLTEARHSGPLCFG